MPEANPSSAPSAELQLSSLLDRERLGRTLVEIHRQMIHVALWHNKPRGSMTPTKLLPATTRRADRSRTDQRDFFYATAGPSGG
jgi:hypothetical protein